MLLRSGYIYYYCGMIGHEPEWSLSYNDALQMPIGAAVNVTGRFNDCVIANDASGDFLVLLIMGLEDALERQG